MGLEHMPKQIGVLLLLIPPLMLTYPYPLCLRPCLADRLEST